MKLVQGMFENVRSRVRIGEGLGDEFELKVGVHQGSVPSPLLFIIVLDALSREFRARVPWEDLYADDLVIIADSMEKMCLFTADLEGGYGEEGADSERGLIPR